jgi:hypothetical protein
MIFSKKCMYQNTRHIFYLPSTFPPLANFANFVDSLLIWNWPHWHQVLGILTSHTWFWPHSRTGVTLVCATVKLNWEFGNPCGENISTETKIKNWQWQNFCLHPSMSKHVLKKDPSLPSQIWDAYHPPNTLGTTLLWSAAGGRGLHRLQTFIFAA